jgi:hypothetical protein
MIGTAVTTDPSLLPATFVSALRVMPPHQAVAFGDSEFYPYVGLQPRGASVPLSVYAPPTTTAGTVLAACLLQDDRRAFFADCESHDAAANDERARPWSEQTARPS